jgi:hypothetical protein
MKFGFWFFVGILFCSGVLAECDRNQIDINSASLTKLDEIVWVGEATAEKIIDGRPFRKLGDLDDVRGIGEKKLEDIIDEGLACVEGNEDEDIPKDNGVPLKGNEGVEYFEDEDSATDFEDEDLDWEGEGEFEEVVFGNDEVFLGEGSFEDEVVYESKEYLAVKYAPFVLVIFVLLVFGWVVVSR